MIEYIIKLVTRDNIVHEYSVLISKFSFSEIKFSTQ
jgi:hypothetical protein